MTEDRFFDEFAEDFFAESSENLATVRRVLLNAEAAAQTRSVLRDEELSQLLRSLHTIKGLCGMVGLTNAAAVAHGMEDALRAADLSARSAPGTSIEALFSAARTLEACLNAHRSGSQPPDVDETLRSLAQMAKHEDRNRTQVSDAAASQDRSYNFVFHPSASLNAQGITVDAVRTRLQSLGGVTRVVPRIADGGAIYFEFDVVVEAGREPDEEWREQGIAWTVNTTTAPANKVEAAAILPKSNLVRVELNRLDELMIQVGDLVMSRARLQDSVEKLQANRSNATVNEVENISEVIERQLRDLRAAVMRVRLVPVGEVFERMRFVARDVASETGKQARVEVEGGSTEIDKVIVERMLEPLLHLVRNAISHGIESPAERTRIGKDPIGIVRLRAESAGDEIVIHVDDDGRGIDIDEVRRIAAERGVARDLIQNARSVLDLLSLPGFSTQDSVDLASGRGVGMSVVRSTVSDLSGELSLETEPGRCSRFTIRLPLTLMIVDALLVSVADQIIAVPQPSLREVLQIAGDEIVAFENNEAMSYRGGVLPLIRLRSVFGARASEVRKSNVLVVGVGAQAVGLVVDRLVGLREIVVRSLSDPLVTVPGVAGAAELSDGSITLILDTAGLVRHALTQKRGKPDVLSIRRFGEGRSA